MQIRRAVLVACGLIVGAVGASIAARYDVHERQSKAATTTTQPPPTEGALSSKTSDSRLRELEREVARIDRRSRRMAKEEARHEAESGPEPDEHAASANDVDEREVDERAAEHFRKLVDSHQTETLDPEWAQEAESALGQDLDEISRGGSFSARVSLPARRSRHVTLLRMSRKWLETRASHAHLWWYANAKETQATHL